MKIGRAKREALTWPLTWPPAWEPPWQPSQGLLCPRRPCGASGLDDWRRWAEHVEDEGRRLHSELLDRKSVV